MHCAAGINRSGFVAAAELLLHARLPVLEVVARLRAARGVGLPTLTLTLAATPT